jgi:hypothetical protein
LITTKDIILELAIHRPEVNINSFIDVAVEHFLSGLSDHHPFRRGVVDLPVGSRHSLCAYLTSASEEVDIDPMNLHTMSTRVSLTTIRYDGAELVGEPPIAEDDRAVPALMHEPDIGPCPPLAVMDLASILHKAVTSCTQRGEGAKAEKNGTPSNVHKGAFVSYKDILLTS